MNYDQSENAWDCQVEEHKKLCHKQVSKVILHFVWDQQSRKHTVKCGIEVQNEYISLCVSLVPLLAAGREQYEAREDPFTNNWHCPGCSVKLK